MCRSQSECVGGYVLYIVFNLYLDCLYGHTAEMKSSSGEGAEDRCAVCVCECLCLNV